MNEASTTAKQRATASDREGRGCGQTAVAHFANVNRSGPKAEQSHVRNHAVRLRIKRREGDSNPRSGYPDTAFPVLHNRPLCHLSCVSGGSATAMSPTGKYGRSAFCRRFRLFSASLSHSGFPSLNALNRNHATTKLPIICIQMSPNGIARQCLLAGNIFLSEFGFKSRELLL